MHGLGKELDFEGATRGGCAQAQDGRERQQRRDRKSDRYFQRSIRLGPREQAEDGEHARQHGGQRQRSY